MQTHLVRLTRAMFSILFANVFHQQFALKFVLHIWVSTQFCVIHVQYVIILFATMVLIFVAQSQHVAATFNHYKLVKF